MAARRRIGPICRSSRTWVPYDQISRNLKRAIIASEDANFVNNNGYETDAILQAWEKNKARGKIVAGGSTISQQLARNLFLSREKSYVRKAQEFDHYVDARILDGQGTHLRDLSEFGRVGQWRLRRRGGRAVLLQDVGGEADCRAKSARLAVMLPRPSYFDEHRNSAYLAQRTRVIAKRMGAAELPE